MGNKIFLERKPLLFQPLEHRGESSASHFTIFSKRLKVQNKELFKTKMLWKNYFIQWISWIFLLPYKLARYSADRQRVKWSSERKISSVPVFKQDLQKSGKRFTVIKNCIQIIMIKTRISHWTRMKNSSRKLKSHHFNCFSFRESLIHVMLDWKFMEIFIGELLKGTPVNIPPTAPPSGK